MPTIRRQQIGHIPPRTSYYCSPISHDYVSHDYGIDSSINRAEHFSNSVLDDTYDAAARSRGRDYELLRNANAAIMATEQHVNHVNPRSSTVSRRVRASTAPPAQRRPPVLPAQRVKISQVAAEVPSSNHHLKRPVLICLPPSSSNQSSSTINSNIKVSKPVVLSIGEVPWLVNARAGSVPPMVHLAPSSPVPRKKGVNSSQRSESVNTRQLHAHRPPINHDVLWRARARSLEPSRRQSHYLEDEIEELHERPIYHPQITAIKPRATHPMPENSTKLIKTHIVGGGPRLRHLTRAVSEPRNLDRPSDYYPAIPDVKRKMIVKRTHVQPLRVGTTVTSHSALPPSVPRRNQGPSRTPKAAIIGSRMEAEDGGKRYKRPRTQFAANRLREFAIDDLERRYK